jgi:hypothetical protein
VARVPPVPDFACRKCGGVAFTTRWQTFSDGTRHVRMECAACGAFARYLPQRPDGAPHYRVEVSSLPSSHPAVQPPPVEFVWVGMVRTSDMIWRVVGTAPTLKRCWDVLLSHPSEGDRLAWPCEPPPRPAVGRQPPQQVRSDG